MSRSKHVSTNYVNLLNWRQVDDRISHKFQSQLHVTDNLISRLGLEKELEGHAGCVNCLEWNEGGSVLASASDDVRFILWDPFNHKRLHVYETGHHGNIFTVKFLPKTKDNIVVTGAGDCRIRVHDVELKETTLVCSCHTGRVKRVTTAPNLPYMFWSAAEDGMILEFDLRAPHLCATQTNNVLINLVPHMGPFAEAKCLAINPRRPEMLAVGANDPYIRLYDRRMIRPITIEYPPEGVPRNNWSRYKYLCSKAENNLSDACVQYFVAGHLSGKQRFYMKKYRNLASTYLTFSASGTELLVNLGGEQIYLFDVNNKRQPKNYGICLKDIKQTTNGYSNGYKSSNGYTNSAVRESTGGQQAAPTNAELVAKLEALKRDANNAFEMRHYTSAIRLYNKAVNLCPSWALLYSNRAAAYMKRNWLAKCLLELHLTEDAFMCLSVFKEKFPREAHSRVCKALAMDIETASTKSQLSAPETSSVPDAGEEGSSDKPDSLLSDHKLLALSDQEQVWRQDSSDYETRFCGHCNTTTDIKEANFFGSEGQYIVAGSDDGSFFVWDRATTNIVQVLRGDDSIVNCLQPHPTSCLLATSGIDPVVRLWSPRPEDGLQNDRMVLNLDDAASANQKRMNADPFEVMLMNMGYRLDPAAGDGETEGEEGLWATNTMNCRTS